MKDIVEDFKEWKSGHDKRHRIRNSIISLIWALSVFFYLALGMFLGVWHPSWLIFLLAAVITHIVNMIFIFREDS